MSQSYYAFEIKSQSSARDLGDAIAKTRSVIALDHSTKEKCQGNNSPAVSVFFAFGSDLSLEGKSEFTRYKELDSAWNDDPVIKVICVVGRGYWAFLQTQGWRYQPATPTFDEVLVLLSQTVNTLVLSPIVSNRPAPLFGDYLRPPDERAEALDQSGEGAPVKAIRAHAETDEANHPSERQTGNAAASAHSEAASGRDECRPRAPVPILTRDQGRYRD